MTKSRESLLNETQKAVTCMNYFMTRPHQDRKLLLKEGAIDSIYVILGIINII